MSSNKKRARAKDETDSDGTKSTKAHKCLSSSKIWVDGRLVDRPSTYPTSYGVLFYRRRRVGGSSSSSGNDHRSLRPYEFQYLLGLIPQRNFWTVFKGMSEEADSNGRSESPFETAIREFEEESSLRFPYKDNSNDNNEDEEEANDDDGGDNKAQRENWEKSDGKDDEDRRRCALDFTNEIWPPPELSTKTTGSVPFLSTVLHGITSRRKLLEIYLIPDPDEPIGTAQSEGNDFTTHPATTSPTKRLDISKFDVDKVVKIDGGYMKGRPEIVQLAWLTRRQAVDDGIVPSTTNKNGGNNDTKSSPSSSSSSSSKSKPIKIYNSQISIIDRAEELLQRHYFHGSH